MHFSTHVMLGLAGIALLGSFQSTVSLTDPTPISTTEVNQTLGLAHSFTAEVQVLAELEDQLMVGLDVQGVALLLDLQPHSVRAANFNVRAQLDDGSWVDLPPTPVRTYRGSVVNDPGSVVAASMLADGLHARVRLSDGQEYWVEPLASRLAEAGAGLHALYRTEDVLASGGNCDADQLTPFAPNDPGGFDPITLGPGTAAGTAVATAEIACDADFEYFSTHGSGTQARIESVISALNLQYSRDVGISHVITTILIRTSSNDPYSRKGAEQLLNQFRTEWNNNHSGIQRDVAHLFTGRNLAGSTIGIAYVGVVCNLSVAYGLVESDFNSNFACVTDLSAHELGHNWGASHCSCSGFTMNASITCANVFNPSGTIPAITGYRDSQSCFGGGMTTTGTVAGTVTSSDGGAAIAGATVQTSSGQSDTTDGNGSYSIAGVPTGSRTVTASATGFVSANQNVTVTENQTTTADFSLDPAPAGSQAIVDCITYRASGGRGGTKNLDIDVTIVNDMGAPIAGASVSVSVDLDGAPFGTASGTTDSAGQVTFQARNSPNGCFETDVTGVTAAGLSFDGSEPSNGFSKGSDSSPDPDCRSGSDACGAG